MNKVTSVTITYTPVKGEGTTILFTRSNHIARHYKYTFKRSAMVDRASADKPTSFFPTKMIIHC